MAAPTKTSDFIQKVIVKDDLLLQGNDIRDSKCPWSFYVHASLLKKLEERLNVMFPRNGWEIYEKRLQFGSKWLDMYQIVILRGHELDELCDLIKASQYSFPLGENPTLFVAAPTFNIVEKFIRDHQLEPFVIKTEEMAGISIEDSTIKIVTFNKNVNKKLNIIEEFRRRLWNINTNYFYMTFRFSWEQPLKLRNRLVHDNVGLVFPIILHHLETITNYKTKLNIMDLLSLRLAVDEVRNPFQPSCITSKIDALIKQMLAKYVKNDHFDLNQYLVDTNSENALVLCKYLIYEFQDLFKTVNYNHKDTYVIAKVKIPIEQKYDNEFLNTIKDNFNIRYKIDGHGFDKMSSSLFFGLLECANVLEINLDTNYPWIKDAPKHKRIVAAGVKNIITDVNLRGGNFYRFADDCIAELKTWEFDRIELDINCCLADYRILDNLNVNQIFFDAIRIDTGMLRQLHQCNIKSPIAILSCPLENSWQAWELLNNLGELQDLTYITIVEDEGTWGSMFEYVIQELHRTNLKEFQFKTDIRLTSEHSPENDTYLELVKFTFDDQMTKLEIRDRESNDLVDFFFENSYIEPDENFDFEFYQ